MIEIFVFGLFALALGSAAWDVLAPVSSRPAPPPMLAFVYRRPDEVAYRLRVGRTFKTARERGIFGTRAKAESVARNSGLVPFFYGDI